MPSQNSVRRATARGPSRVSEQGNTDLKQLDVIPLSLLKAIVSAVRACTQQKLGCCSAPASSVDLLQTPRHAQYQAIADLIDNTATA